MKHLRKYIGVILIMTIMNNLVAQEVKLPLEIKNEKYSAKISRSGFLSSIKVGDDEYLSAASNIPGGFYIIAGGRPSLKDFVKISDNTYQGQNSIAKVTYTFDPNKISVKLTEVKKSGVIYMIINDSVKTLNFMTSKSDVPTITATPANSSCVQTRWFQEGTSLDIAGSNKIWGPWKGHQVWELKLTAGEDRTIEFTPGNHKTEAAVNADEGIETPLESFTYADATTPAQIPICMIGDSITWAGEGDYWRKFLQERIPRLAFVGTHSAVLGYSHAGEGGNSTSKVINRLDMIPHTPYYSLLIGTNDTGLKDPARSKQCAIDVSGRIEKIVQGLLKKEGVKKIFLCSILPCHTENPLRDKNNSLTNEILREKMKTTFAGGKVAWVEFEKPIRKINDWESKIILHPTIEGYKIVADIHADAIAKELGITDKEKKPEPKANTGVRVNNIIDKKTNITTIPVIAGWYTVSFDMKKTGSEKPQLKIESTRNDVATPFKQTFDLSKYENNQRVTLNLFTNYEGYGYTRTRLKLEAENCSIDRVMFEKSRPSKKASVYGEGIYIDTETKPALGELVEFNK